MKITNYRAFSDARYDYYELLQPLADIVPVGAIFVHDPYDHIYGSIVEGCLKLCWTPEGDCYIGEKEALCAETVIFHACFKDSVMFRKVQRKSDHVKDKIEAFLDSLCVSIAELREQLSKV